MSAAGGGAGLLRRVLGAPPLPWRLRAALGRAYPRLVGANREPAWVFYELLLPTLGVTAFVYVYRALQAPPEFTAFVVLGGATVAFWVNVMWMMAAQLYWEKHSANLELYIMAPCGLVPILLGMALGAAISTTLRAGAIVALGVLIFHAPLSTQHWPLVLLVFLVAMVGLYGLGMLLASLFLMWGRETWHLAQLLQEPVYLLSGFFFPVRALGLWVGLAASLIPLTLALDATRQLLFPQMANGLFPLPWEVAGLVVLAVLFPLLALGSLRLMERRARVEGRISLRWQ